MVGVDNNFPPFEYADERGTPAGYNVDLIKAVAQEMQIPVRVIVGPWSEIRAGFEAGEIDVLSGMLYSKRRTEYIDFSIPHSSVTYSIFVRKSEHGIRSEKDLPGHVVLTQQGDLITELLNARGLHPVPVPDTQSALRMLANGSGDAVVVAKVVGLYHMREAGIRDLRIAGNAFEQQSYCFAVRRNRGDALLQRLNEGLMILKYNGEQERIAKKWLGPWQERGVALRYVLVVIAVSVCLLLLAFLWSWMLRSKVREKTASLQLELAERRRAEQRVLKLNRLYAVTSGINKAIARARSRGALFEEVCRLIAESGQYPLIWVGRIDWTTHAIRPAAHAGRDGGYLASINASTLEQRPEGRGPAGTVAREGRHCVVSDVQKDERMLPWRAMCIEHGYHSCASFPLTVDGKPVAVLTMYASEPRFFDDPEEIALLDGVASDLSFALEVIEREQQRKRAERALQESEERFRTAFEQAAIGMVLVDSEGKIQATNNAFCEMVGYRQDELVGAEILAPWLTHPDDAALSEQSIGKLINGESSRVEFEKRYIHRDGRAVWADVTTSGIRDANGNYKLSVGQIQNITGRKLAEAELRKANWHMEAMLDASPVAIIALDPQGRVTAWNKASERMFGWTEQEVLGRPHPIVPPDMAEEHSQLRDTVLQGKGFESKELKRQRKDGTLLDVSLSASPLRDAEGNITGGLTLYADNTERRRLEAQLLQSQKLESVGRLAGGVAHDFNNLLTVINCYGDLLLAQLSSKDPLRQGVEEIRKAGAQAASLTRQLLAFSRRQVLQFKLLNLNEVVEDMKELMQRLIGEDIELIFELDSQLGQVKADPGQLQQVLMNLVVNARDAMPNGGRLSIRTQRLEIPEQQPAHNPDAQAGPHVLLSVSDTGIGMDEDTQRRIFEPFFTTKAAGTGTGLGLSTVWGIVKQSGGQVSVSSQPGQGTTFTILLPCADEPATPVVVPEQVVASRGTETLLLVEDQPQLRLLTSRILSGYGYTVLEAADGMEALRICQQKNGMIHLVLTDVVMPGVTGIELGRRIKALNPQMKIVYMSGYTDDVILRQGTLEPGAAYLEKPFTPEGLAGKVREVLSSPTSVAEKK